MICTFVRFHIKPGCENQFLELAKPCVEATRLEKGNISYDMGPEFGKICTYTFFERWMDQESIDFHESQPYFQKFDAAIGALTDGPVEVFKIDALFL